MSNEAQDERQEIDPVFKQLVEEEFGAYQVKCQTEYEVSRLPRKIDAFVSIEDHDKLQRIHQGTPFFYLLKDNQLEFKGTGDRLTRDGYHVIRGRMEFLLSKKEISFDEMTVTIISAGKPRSVFEYARNSLKRPFKRAGQKGYYKTNEKPPIYLIVVNELPVIPKNYSLLIFASSKRKFREFLNEVIVTGEHTYIRYAYKVRPQVTKEVLAMAGVQTRLKRADLEFIIEDIGQDLFALANPEDVLKGMNVEKQKQFLGLFSPKERLADVTVEERLADVSIDELLRGISSEKREMLASSLEKMGKGDESNR